MVTLAFCCPNCEVHCIRRVARIDDMFCVANSIPLLVSCWNCRTESLVVPKTVVAYKRGSWDSLVGHCERIAMECTRRASAASSSYAHDFFRNTAQYWLHVAQQRDTDQASAVVGAIVWRNFRGVSSRIA
jgi:hypothetical protein